MERRATLVSAEYNQESYWQQMTWPALIKQTKFFRPNIICSNYKGRSICVLASSDVDSAIDIADPSSIQAACHIWSSWWASLAVESLWLSDRASESGIQWSEVRFLMGTKNLFFVPRWWQDKRHFSISLPSSKLTIFLNLFIITRCSIPEARPCAEAAHLVKENYFLHLTKQQHEGKCLWVGI